MLWWQAVRKGSFLVRLAAHVPEASGMNAWI